MSAAAAGAGRPDLLLIHGLGGSRSIWEPVIPLLEGEREVHAIDMPGFGKAPPLPEGTEPTAANLARALHEECARNGVERPHVAGNSLGGWVALEMGRFGWAASVTALSPAGLWSRPLGEPAGGGARMLLRGSPWVKAARPLLAVALQFPQTRHLAFQSIAAHPERIPPAAARELVLGWLDGEGYDAANRAMRSHVFDPAGYPEGVPVTIAWCERDRLVGPPKRPRRPAGARFLVLPKVGHTPTWDDPELVARTLLEGSAVTSPVPANKEEQ
ncbi:MAG TPA: alpha/beta hydrolase [Solirubrobacterales bacterium]|nr:alpha/beta hydrolase [Solirubrobacterales bacterium]